MITDAGDTARPLPVRPPRPVDTSAAGRAVATVPAEERGRTTLADRVVEKIAARAAVDIAHAAGVSRRVAGRDVGSPAVRARADVDGKIASLRLELAVEYPASVRATSRSVRAHVDERVGALCGLTVDHIDIAVVVLRRPESERKRVR